MQLLRRLLDCSKTLMASHTLRNTTKYFLSKLWLALPKAYVSVDEIQPCRQHCLSKSFLWPLPVPGNILFHSFLKPHSVQLHPLPSQSVASLSSAASAHGDTHGPLDEVMFIECQVHSTSIITSLNNCPLIWAQSNGHLVKLNRPPFATFTQTHTLLPSS